MATGFSTLADNAIDLKDQTATFTNRQGRVYENVQLKRATADGLIYCDTNSSAMGMVHYPDLPASFLASLKIPDSMIAEAAQRQATLAAQKQQYDAAVRQLALEEKTNNVAKLATPAPTPAPAPAAPTRSTTTAEPKNKPTHRHHHA
ncbi:MAG TPA: hypothetical protein VL863_07685 [bacterium]|nr:hypothetical protein [bacterium]